MRKSSGVWSEIYVADIFLRLSLICTVCLGLGPRNDGLRSGPILQQAGILDVVLPGAPLTLRSKTYIREAPSAEGLILHAQRLLGTSIMH
jgi:hypothetical protein